ncbi:hypothetical protein IV102_01055 [bacterium]|nr:hypothetical protein [bacterium]
MQINPNNAGAMRIAQKVIDQVDREKAKVAEMDGTRYDAAPKSDSVELKNVVRNPVKRMVGTALSGDYSEGGWNAKAQFKEPFSKEVVDMTSSVKDDPYSPSKEQKLEYHETPEQKTYSVFNREVTFGDGAGYVGRKEHCITVTVNRATGALFMEES